MNRNFLKLLLFGFLGGVTGAYLFIFIGDNYLGGILFSNLTSGNVTATTDIVISEPSPGVWERSVSEASLSTVSIQVFQTNKLVRQASGVIVSSDGLIVTVADIAVPGGIYQVFYDDKIVIGTISARNYSLNLLLLKTPNTYSNVAYMKSSTYRAGQEVSLLGKLVDLSSPAIFAQRGLISYVSGSNIIIDTAVNTYLAGAGVIDAEGSFLGLSQIRKGKINLIKAETVNNFVKESLDKEGSR